jgi:uncharacterized protein YprB with RNaseH-like and TPR domain
MGTMTDKFSRLSALRPVRSMPARPATLRAPDEVDPLGRLLGAGIARNHYGEHLAIRNWFASPEYCEPSAVALELLSRTGMEKASRTARTALSDPEKWLFLDTETTGLAGGTGTYAFLIGLAWWDSGGLQVEQLFLRDYSEEHSILHELAGRLAERPVLVTFNGKTFDWPLLQSRFAMTRAIAIPKIAAHLDLLHPARALWRLRLGSVRLVELERHVLEAERLGWERGADVSSALIPQYYFDYLRGGAADPLAGVVKHNQMDLRGLAALFGKINSLLDEEACAAEERDSLDMLGLSKFLHRRGERDRAHSACAQALDAGLPAEFRAQATRELAQMAKRRGDSRRSAELWQELVGDPADGVAACRQLAIHYEREMKDFAKALEFARLGLAKLERARRLTRNLYEAARIERLEETFRTRAKRLEERIAKGEKPLLARRKAASN